MKRQTSFFHIPGRVMMGMTTLLTLSSSFASLSTVTPPISYTTRLDIWMVACIVFVFLTMAEFTLVIILKYYLVDHLPAFCFEHFLRKPSHRTTSLSKTENVDFIEKFVFENVEKASIISTQDFSQKLDKSSHTERKKDIFEQEETQKLKSAERDRKKGFQDSQRSTKSFCIEKDYEKFILDEKQRISQHIIKIIEKNGVFVFLVAFLTFNVIYWRDIALIKSDIKQKFEINNFNIKL